jgi:hypothetical protein
MAVSEPPYRAGIPLLPNIAILSFFSGIIPRLSALPPVEGKK